VELCAQFHEEGAHAVYFGAAEHEPRVRRLDTRAANVQPMLQERREADAVATQARIDSTSHLLVNRVRVSSL
jgi:hypothetical protein